MNECQVLTFGKVGEARSYRAFNNSLSKKIENPLDRF